MQCGTIGFMRKYTGKYSIVRFVVQNQFLKYACYFIRDHHNVEIAQQATLATVDYAFAAHRHGPEAVLHVQIVIHWLVASRSD